MKPVGFLCGVLLATLPLGAQQYQLRDGSFLSAEEVVVRGGRLVESLEADGGEAEVERSYPLSDVVRLDWPEPEALEAARAAQAVGRSDEVIALVEPVRMEFVLFAKVPGSWWTAASLLRLQALLRADRAADAEEAARELIATATDPEAVGLARLGLAQQESVAGRADIAAAMVDSILAEDVPAGVHARAALLRGDLALQRGDAGAALEAYLRIPVFHGLRRDLLPEALAGSVRAYRLSGDEARTERAASELAREFPDSPEAAQLAADGILSPTTS